MASIDERVKARRVQRLGTSSLVVTLPKDWVRRVGLKPGDYVYVIDEGGSVRVVPVRGGEQAYRVIEVDASKLPEVNVSRLVSCAYILHVDVLRVRGVGWEAALEARSAASKLTGVDVSSGTDYIEVRSLVDDTKIEAEELLANISRLASDIAGLASRLLREPTSQVVSLAREAYSEILRYQHLTVRRLLSLGVSPSPQREAAVVLAAAALGNSAAALWHLTNYLATLYEAKGELPKSEELEKLLGAVREALQKLPDAKTPEALAELGKNVQELTATAWRMMLNTEESKTAAAATLLHNALKQIEIAINALTCISLLLLKNR